MCSLKRGQLTCSVTTGTAHVLSDRRSCVDHWRLLDVLRLWLVDVLNSKEGNLWCWLDVLHDLRLRLDVLGDRKSSVGHFECCIGHRCLLDVLHLWLLDVLSDKEGSLWCWLDVLHDLRLRLDVLVDNRAGLRHLGCCVNHRCLLDALHL